MHTITLIQTVLIWISKLFIHLHINFSLPVFFMRAFMGLIVLPLPILLFSSPFVWVGEKIRAMFSGEA
jgi:hypothetical protein